MADISRLLNEATGRGEQVRKRLEEEQKEKESQSPAEDAVIKQLKQSWLTSTVTQEMFQSIGLQARALEDSAMELAANSFDEEARIKITHLLIKAKALREVIQKYTK